MRQGHETTQSPHQGAKRFFHFLPGIPASGDRPGHSVRRTAHDRRRAGWRQERLPRRNDQPAGPPACACPAASPPPPTLTASSCPIRAWERISAALETWTWMTWFWPRLAPRSASGSSTRRSRRRSKPRSRRLRSCARCGQTGRRSRCAPPPPPRTCRRASFAGQQEPS